MMAGVREEVVSMLFHVEVSRPTAEASAGQNEAARLLQYEHESLAGADAINRAAR